MDNADKAKKELAELFYSLKSGERAPKEAKEMNNSAGKIIGFLRAELEYRAQRGDQSEMPYFHGPDGR